MLKNLLQNRKFLIIGGVAALIIIIALAFAGHFAWNKWGPGKVVPAIGEPINIVLDFYQPWLEAKAGTTTSPFKEYGNSNLLSHELRSAIAKAPKGPDDVDPVLCLVITPEQLVGRTIFETPEEAEVLVTGRNPSTGEQAIVTLLPLEGGWYIDSIRCSPGEFGVEREFSFEQEGFLLKQVPPPLDPNNWYLVFEENGQPGHFAPLFFSAQSQCKALDGSTAVCTPDTFRETTKVKVQGEMTELGVQVKNLEILKN